MTRIAIATLALTSVICSLPLPLTAQAARGRLAASPGEPPSADSLAGITRRGRALAEHDRAARLASEAVAELSADTASIRRHLVRWTGEGWEVAFGALSASRDTFLVAYVATPGIQRDKWAASAFDVSRPDTGYYLRAARAIETALAMFLPAQSRPYDAAAVPAEDGPWWWVYLYPAPRRPGTWPHGGDVRFRVSADGRVITDTRRLHDAIAEYAMPAPGRQGPHATHGTAARSPALDVVPEDTDVFHVLRRRPSMPEILTTAAFVYRIDVDGSIRYLRRAGS